MKLSDEIRVKAQRTAVFDALCDAKFFASCIDGVSDLTEIDATHYAAVIETRLSFMKFKFKLTVHLLRIESPREIEVRIEGTPIGILGRMTAASLTTLTEADGETRICTAIDLALTGKLGGLGQSAFSAKAREMSKQFGDNLRAALESQPIEAVR